MTHLSLEFGVFCKEGLEGMDLVSHALRNTNGQCPLNKKNSGREH